MTYDQACKMKEEIHLLFAANFGLLWTKPVENEMMTAAVSRAWLGLIRPHSEEVIRLAADKACDAERPPTPAQFRFFIKAAQQEWGKKSIYSSIVKEVPKKRYKKNPPQWLLEHLDAILAHEKEREKSNSSTSIASFFGSYAIQNLINKMVNDGVWCEEGEEQDWEKTPDLIENMKKTGDFNGYKIGFYK